MAGGVFWICVGVTSDFLRYFTNRRYIKGICGGGTIKGSNIWRVILGAMDEEEITAKDTKEPKGLSPRRSSWGIKIRDEEDFDGILECWKDRFYLNAIKSVFILFIRGKIIEQA